MPSFLDATALAKLLQKIKTVFATKTEVVLAIDNADANCIHKTENETIAGMKTFSFTLSDFTTQTNFNGVASSLGLTIVGV